MAAAASTVSSAKQAIAKLVKDKGCAPILVRLAWHASGTFDVHDGSGGCTGATMRYGPEKDWDANKGLQIARDLLEPIKEQHSADMSYADLWTLAGCVAVETAGGPTIPWKPGRTDSPAPGQECPAGQKEKKIVEDGRLPDAAQGAAHVREVFTRMGFNDREAVALCGAHSLGKCHTDRSGYDGPWTPEPLIFDNTYFTELLSREWVWKSDVDASWSGPPQLVDKATGKLMMLPTDWALVADPAYNAICKEFAASQDAFFAAFAPAFAKLLELGCEDHVKTQCPHHTEARL